MYIKIQNIQLHKLDKLHIELEHSDCIVAKHLLNN